MFLDGYLGQLLSGTVLTIEVAVCAILLGSVLGLIGASGELSHSPILRVVSRAITSIIRGLPELLTLFAIYFGGTILLTKLFGKFTEVNAFTSGVVALGLIFGAYASQVFRGAFLIIHKGQKEAAKALGLSSWLTFKKIMLPQAWRHALPGLGNLWLTTLKDSSLVALIGLADLTNKTQLAATQTYKPFTFYMTCALIYLGLTSITQIIFILLKQRSLKHEH